MTRRNLEETSWTRVQGTNYGDYPALNLSLLYYFDQRNWHQLAYPAPCIGIRRSVCRTKLNFVFLSLQLRGISKSYHFVFSLIASCVHFTDSGESSA